MSSAIVCGILAILCLCMAWKLITKIDGFYIITFGHWLCEYVPPAFFMWLTLMFSSVCISKLTVIFGWTI